MRVAHASQAAAQRLEPRRGRASPFSRPTEPHKRRSQRRPPRPLGGAASHGHEGVAPVDVLRPRRPPLVPGGRG